MNHAARLVGSVLAAIALASVGVTALTFAAPLWWPLELLTHFRVQYLAVQLPLLIALLVLHRPFAAAALGAAVMANAWPVAPYLPLAGGSTLAHASGPNLRVLAVNVLWQNDDPDPLVASIARERPDIIVVSEFTDAWDAHLEALAGVYPHSVRVTGYGAFGIALYSKHPFIAREPFALGTTPAIDATIETGTAPLRVVAVHLRPPVSKRSANERNAQLAELARIATEADGAFVIAGDFNISPYSPYFRTLLRDGGLADARSGYWPGGTWPVGQALMRTPIDHVVVRRGMKVAAFARLEDIGSDHYPIMADLQWPVP